MIKLYPMIYSKNKTVEKISIALILAPEQKPNSPEVYQGKVMEFRTEKDHRPGTLPELVECLKENEFTVVAIDGTINIEKIDETFCIMGMYTTPEQIRKAYHQ